MAVLDHRNGTGLTLDGIDLSRRRSVARSGDLAVVRPESHWQRTYMLRCMMVDLAAALLAGVAAYLARWGPSVKAEYLVAVIGLPIVWPVAVGLNRAYESRFLGVGSEEFRRVGRAALSLTAVVAFTAYAFNIDFARRWILLGLPVTAILTLCNRYLLRRWLHRQRAAGAYLHRVVLVGHESPVLEMIRRLGEERFHGLQVVAACLPVPGQRPALMDFGVPVVGGFTSVAEAVRLTDADTVAVLASPDLGPEQLRRLAWELEPTGADLMVAPSLVEVAGPRLSIRPVSGLPLLQVEQPQFSGGRRLVKDSFDKTLALCAIVALSPLLIGTAVAVRVTSKGPAIFKQQRIGRGGQAFTMYKFRSMVVDAEVQREALLAHSDGDGLLFKMQRDPDRRASCRERV